MANSLRRVYDFGGRHIDYKMGVLGAGVLGGLVAIINSHEGILPATTAALKQGTYTFLLGGLVTKSCEKIVKKIRRKTLAYTLAIIIPSAATNFATYGLHNMKGTPEPFKSTVPTMVMSPLWCTYWAHRKRREVFGGEEES